MAVKIEIVARDKYQEAYEQEMRDAQVCRGTLRLPRIVSLPKNQVLVVKGLPGEPEIDVEIDCFR